MSKLFVVKKPCVIECVYYEAGGIYSPSNHMACTALKELIDHGFLEEKPGICNSDKEALDNYLVVMRVQCGFMRQYLNSLSENLKKASEKLKEM